MNCAQFTTQLKKKQTNKQKNCTIVIVYDCNFNSTIISSIFGKKIIFFKVLYVRKCTGKIVEKKTTACI